MDLTLHIWRQKGPQEKGRMVEYKLGGVSADSSFLEMLDQLNEELQLKGEEPVAFDHDCREGICGMCSLVINGTAHGKRHKEDTTTCQLHMRHFKDGDHIYIEPFRAHAFPVLKDLITDRSAFDRIIAAGGFISVNTGGTPDANLIAIPKKEQEIAMDAAACIGCGACVAACKNASAMLFVSAKVSHLAHLPQGDPERQRRALAMIEQHDKEGFGSCTNYEECAAVCPAHVKIDHIATLNREYLRAGLVMT